MKFFHNPKKKRTTAKRRARVKRGAGGKFVSRKRTKRTATAKRRRTGRRASTAARKRRVIRTGVTMAKRRRKAVRKTTARRRRRSSGSIRLSRVKGAVYKRNPNVVGVLVRGVKDATVAVAGKTAARFIGSKLPALVPGQTGQAVNSAIAAAVIGMLGQKFLGADMARLMVQGALQAPIETALQPVLSGIGLSAYPMRGRLAAYNVPALAGYAAPAAPSLASYPQASQSMIAAYPS